MGGTALAIVLTALGIAGQQAFQNATSYFGAEERRLWNKKIAELSSIINKNSQALSDWKTANEAKKQGIISALMASPGFGARANSLKTMYQKAMKQDKEKTDEVNSKNKEINQEIAKTEVEADKAAQHPISSGVARWYRDYYNKHSPLGGHMNEPTEVDQSMDISQNITAGLTGGKD